MKKIVVSAIVIMFAIVVKAQPPAGDAKPGDWYGEKITADGATNIADVAAKLDKTESVDTKIKAKIVDVCPKKGCWLKLQVNDSTTAKGKTVVLDGVAQIKTTSVAELKHYAEDAKKSKEEIAAITKPEKEIRVTAKGIVIVE
jgi:DNA-directed RNA polymerase subunit F